MPIRRVGSFLGLLPKGQAHPICSMEALGASHGASSPAVQESLSEVRVPCSLLHKFLCVNWGHDQGSEAETLSHGSFYRYRPKLR